MLSPPRRKGQVGGDLAELGDVDSILDAIDSTGSSSSSCTFRLGQEALLHLSSSTTAAAPSGLNSVLSTQLLSKAFAVPNSAINIAGPHAHALLPQLCQVHLDSSSSSTTDMMSKLHRATQLTSALPISFHAILTPQKQARVARVDCTNMFLLDSYTLPVEKLVASAEEDEQMIALLRLLHGVEFAVQFKPSGGGVEACVSPASQPSVAEAAAELGVAPAALEQCLLHRAKTSQQAARNRDKLILLLFVGWLNHSLCSVAEEGSSGDRQEDEVHIWTTPLASSPDAFAADLLQRKAAAITKQSLDGATILRIPASAAVNNSNTSVLSSDSFTSALDASTLSAVDAAFANLDALFVTSGSSGLKPSYASALLQGLVQSELPMLSFSASASTHHQFWIRSGEMHVNNPLKQMAELQGTGALFLIKASRTLPVCECSLQELANVANLVPSARDEFDNRESAQRVLDAFETTAVHFGASTQVFFQDSLGLYALVWSLRVGGGGFPSGGAGVWDAGLARLRERTAAANDEAAAATSRRRARMSKKLELTLPSSPSSRPRFRLQAVVRTLMLFQRLCKTEQSVLMRGAVRVVGGEINNQYCVLRRRCSNELELSAFTSRADSFLLLATPPPATSSSSSKWTNITDYSRVSDLSIELFMGSSNAVVVLQFDSEQCNQRWSFAVEQGLQLAQREQRKSKALPPAPAAPVGAAGGAATSNLLRRPSISRNLLGDVVNELVQTERSFISDLGQLLTLFRDPIAQDMDAFQIQPHEFDAIFLNVVQIKVFHEALLLAATGGGGEGSSTPLLVGEAFAQAFRERQVFFSKIYTVYTDRHAAALHTLSACLKRSKRFAKFYQQLVAAAPKQQDLPSFLIKPIQRMVKYPLFFKQMVDWVSREEEQQYPSPQQVLRGKMLETLEVSKRVAQQVTVHDATRELRGVEIMLQGTFEDMPAGMTLCEPGRSFVDEFTCRLVSTATMGAEGSAALVAAAMPDNTAAAAAVVKAKKSSTSKRWHLLVFNDAVMFAKPTTTSSNSTSNATSFKYRGWFELADLKFSIPAHDSTLDILFTPPNDCEEEGYGGEEDMNDENGGDGYNSRRRSRAASSTGADSFKSASSTSSRYSSMKKRSTSFLRRLSASASSITGSAKKQQQHTSSTAAATAAAPQQRFTLAFDTEQSRNQAFAVLNRTHEAQRTAPAGSIVLGARRASLASTAAVTA